MQYEIWGKCAVYSVNKLKVAIWQIEIICLYCICYHTLMDLLLSKIGEIL